MVKKQSPPAKVLIRYPGRPYAELVDPEFAVEFARMREAANERIIRNLEAEKADLEQRQENWRQVKRKAKITLARSEELSLRYRREVIRAARRKLGEE